MQSTGFMAIFTYLQLWKELLMDGLARDGEGKKLRESNAPVKMIQDIRGSFVVKSLI